MNYALQSSPCCCNNFLVLSRFSPVTSYCHRHLISDNFPANLTVSKVIVKIYLPERKIYSSWTIGHDFFRAKQDPVDEFSVGYPHAQLNISLGLPEAKTILLFISAFIRCLQLIIFRFIDKSDRHRCLTFCFAATGHITCHERMV